MCMVIFNCYLFHNFCSVSIILSIILSKPNSDEALASITEASAVYYLRTVCRKAKHSGPWGGKRQGKD